MPRQPDRVIYEPVKILRGPGRAGMLQVTAKVPPAGTTPYTVPYIARLVGLHPALTFQREMLGKPEQKAFGATVCVLISLSRLRQVDVLEIRCTDPTREDEMVRRYYTWLAADGQEGLVETSQEVAIALVKERPAGGWGNPSNPTGFIREMGRALGGETTRALGGETPRGRAEVSNSLLAAIANIPGPGRVPASQPGPGRVRLDPPRKTAKRASPATPASPPRRRDVWLD